MVPAIVPGNSSHVSVTLSWPDCIVDHFSEFQIAHFCAYIGGILLVRFGKAQFGIVLKGGGELTTFHVQHLRFKTYLVWNRSPYFFRILLAERVLPSQERLFGF
jgi:hypothetical protein